MRFARRLLQCYSEEHAIQDLLFYLADGLRRDSIGLDIYLKVRFSSPSLFVGPEREMGMMMLDVLARARIISSSVYSPGDDAKMPSSGGIEVEIKTEEKGKD